MDFQGFLKMLQLHQEFSQWVSKIQENFQISTLFQTNERTNKNNLEHTNHTLEAFVNLQRGAKDSKTVSAYFQINFRAKEASQSYEKQFQLHQSIEKPVKILC